MTTLAAILLSFGTNIAVIIGVMICCWFCGGIVRWMVCFVLSFEFLAYPEYLEEDCSNDDPRELRSTDEESVIFGLVICYWFCGGMVLWMACFVCSFGRTSNTSKKIVVRTIYCNHDRRMRNHHRHPHYPESHSPKMNRVQRNL